MQKTHVLLNHHDSIAFITLNRPQARNAIDLELAKDLFNVAMECDGNPAIRAVVLSGAGSTFSVGGDLKSFVAQGERLSTYIKELITFFHSAVSCLARLNAPVIAAVQGNLAGAGMSLACACDFVLAAESARFTAAYSRIGLTPDGSMTYFLSRCVGIRRALELTLLNRTLSAQEAYQWGIVNFVVPEESLQEQADTLARQLATGPTRAFGITKRLLQQGWNESLETQMMYETQAISTVAGSADSQEGIRAFLEKRSPHFSER